RSDGAEGRSDGAEGRSDGAEGRSDGEDPAGGDPAGDGDEGDADGDASGAEPALVAPPALRFDVGSVTIVNPLSSYGRAASVLGRSLPQTGLVVDDNYAVSRMAIHVPRDLAESLSAQDFSGEVRAYLDCFDRAFPVEVAAGTGNSRETCVSALESLAEAGVAARDDAGRWRTFDTAGGRQG
ncbi:MAG: hypothetical protein ABEJ28_10070, partial [Salinigranum sp.]